MRSTSVLVVSLAVVLAACSDRASPSVDDGLCATILRVPSADVEVMTLGDDGRPVAVTATCGRVGCLRARADAVAVLQPDGTIWAAWQGRPGGVLEGGAAVPGATAAERWARLQALVAPTAPAGAPAAPGIAPPTLPGEFRTCGTTEAGGGYGWHVIRNDGDVWQRIHWGKEPETAEVRALGPDAYPIATETGALCAFAVQEEPRDWRVHLLPSNKIVAAADDNEHPPAWCRGGGSVEIRRSGGLYRYAPDGAETKVQESPTASMQRSAPSRQAEVSVDGTANIARPTGPLRVRTVDGAVRELPLPFDVDLAGKALPRGAVRERLLAAGDGAGAVLVVERVQGADCTVTETLHLLRTDPPAGTAAVTTISSGDVVYAKPVFAAGRFYWLEARPQIVDVAQGAAKAAF